ncbi:MAG: NADH-quinone oxidoreductase subunit A [Spirochaetia bacterium]|nr:NADH-quinone oxidoreductase subunit A [Spirochaetia bacterium]
MLREYGAVLLFSVLSIGFIFVTLLASKIIRPNHPNPVKNSPYECGEVPVGNAWVNFNIRYYVLALIFLLFDVEIVLILPVAAVYKEWLNTGFGLLALSELLLFIAILVVALIYAWGRGDLNWIKTYERANAMDELKNAGDYPLEEK